MKITTLPEYWVYNNIKQKCKSPNHPDWRYYGGRGIKVSEKWTTFEDFYRDMGPRPLGYTVERTDNNGDYSPDNCRWATRIEQAANRRKRITNTSGYVGVTQFNHLGSWAHGKWTARFQVAGKRVHGGYFDTKEEAAVQYAKLKAEYGLL